MAFQESNRGIARSYLTGLYETGMTGSQTLRILRDMGLGYREGDFYTDWREVTGFAKKSDTFKFIRKDYKPTASTIEMTSDNLSSTYSYYYKVSGIDRETGESVEKDWRFSTDDLITRAEAEAEVETRQEYMERELNLSNISITSVGIKQRVYL